MESENPASDILIGLKADDSYCARRHGAPPLRGSIASAPSDPLRRKGKVGVDTSDDEMIDHRDTQKFTCVKEGSGYRAVFCARGRVAGWVIVSEYNPCCSEMHRAPKNLARVNKSTVYGPPTHQVRLDRTGLRVEGNGPHYFDLFIHKHGGEKRCSFAIIGDPASGSGAVMGREGNGITHETDIERQFGKRHNISGCTRLHTIPRIANGRAFCRMADGSTTIARLVQTERAACTHRPSLSLCRQNVPNSRRGRDHRGRTGLASREFILSMGDADLLAHGRKAFSVPVD